MEYYIDEGMNYITLTNEQRKRRANSLEEEYRISEAQHSLEIQSEYIPIWCFAAYLFP